jgi:hypothetical protein
MKRQLAIALGLAVVSTSAFASKARLEALGESGNGSMYLEDNRNVFLNPAHLNHHKDWITLEFGETTADEDNETTPRAEGGVFKASGNMAYGVYFGEEADTANDLRSEAGTNIPEESNNLTLFVAGDAGLQWGASLLIGSDSQTDATDGTKVWDSESKSMRARVGVISGNVDAFLNMGLQNEASYEETAGGSAKEGYKGKSSMDLGVTYDMGNMDLMVRYSSIEAEDLETTGAEVYKATAMFLGAGAVRKLDDKASLNYKVGYNSRKVEGNDFTAGAAGEAEITNFSATIGMEVMAKDWLTLRGSISQELLGLGKTKLGDDWEQTNADSTTIAAGASLVFGDLSVDGYLGNGTATDGQVNTDTLMTRASINYMF